MPVRKQLCDRALAHLQPLRLHQIAGLRGDVVELVLQWVKYSVETLISGDFMLRRPSPRIALSDPISLRCMPRLSHALEHLAHLRVLPQQLIHFLHAEVPEPAAMRLRRDPEMISWLLRSFLSSS